MIDHDLNLDTRTRCPDCDGDKVVACGICDGIGFRIGYWQIFGYIIRTRIDCEACNGRGYITCPRCHGSGEDTHDV